jgi:hypothetical protein
MAAEDNELLEPNSDIRGKYFSQLDGELESPDVDLKDGATSDTDVRGKYFSYLENSQTPEPEEIGDISNAVRGVGARGAELGGQLGTFAIDRFAEVAQHNPLTKLYEYTTDEEIDVKGSDLYKNAMRGADYLKEVELGYEPRYTWERLKDDTSLLNAVGYIGETGLASLPDMLAAVNLYTLPVYMAARSQEIGEERALNKGKTKAELIDVLEAAPFAVASAIFERVGGKAVLDTLPVDTLQGLVKEVGKAALKEGATEAVQEGVIEYTGGKVGTGAEMSLAEAADRGLGAAVAGGGFGGGVRAASGTVDLKFGETAEERAAKSEADMTNAVFDDDVDLDTMSEIAEVMLEPLALEDLRQPALEDLSPLEGVIDDGPFEQPKLEDKTASRDLPAPPLVGEVGTDFYVGEDGAYQTVLGEDVPVREKPKPKREILSAKKQTSPTVAAERSLSEVEVEIAGPVVENTKLPSNLQDPRLKRSNFRGAISKMAEDLELKGGVEIIRSDAVEGSGDQKVSRRTKSVNPEWYQNYKPEKGKKLSVAQSKVAVTKALDGETLTKPEARFVEAILDQYTFERTQDESIGEIASVKARLSKARKERKATKSKAQAEARKLKRYGTDLAGRKLAEKKARDQEITSDDEASVIPFGDDAGDVAYDPEAMGDIVPESGSYDNQKAAHRALSQKKKRTDNAPGFLEKLNRYSPFKNENGDWVLRADVKKPEPVKPKPAKSKPAKKTEGQLNQGN